MNRHGVRPVLSLQGGVDTVKEWCATYRISRTTFYKLVKQGYIRPIKIGRRTLAPRSEHQEWIFRMLQPALFGAEEWVG